jgi:hypothetical protein
MKNLRFLIVFIISWFISALILWPCLFLNLLSGFKIDYHFRFHQWWGEEFLKDE